MATRKPLRTTRQIVDSFGSTIQPRASTDWFNGASMTRTQVSRPQTTHDTRQDMTDATRRLMMGLSRWQYWNTPIGQVIDERASECVGNAWEARYRGETKAWGEAAMEFFWNWGNACDVTGRLSYRDHLRLAVVEHHRDGDGFRMKSRGGSGFPMVQAIPAHRVGLQYGYDNQSVGGIIPNAVGRPIAYRITTDDPRKPAGYYNDDPEDIAARHIHHILHVKFVDQYRGMPAVVRGARTITDQHDIVEFEKVAVKMASSIGLLRSTEDGRPSDAFRVTTEAGVANGDLPLYQFAAGAMPTIPKGWTFESFDHKRPGETWQGFMEYLSRLSLMAMGSRYEYAFDPSSVTGPAMRFVMKREERAIQEDQALIERLARWMWGYVVGTASYLGLIPPLPADWYWVEFTKPKPLSIDVGREAAAEQKDLLLGLTTKEESYASRGMDYQAARLQRRAEVGELLQDAQAFAAQYDISIEQAIALLEERDLPTDAPASGGTDETKETNEPKRTAK